MNTAASPQDEHPHEYDAIIVDTPGSLRDEDVLGAVLDLADFAILPITTSTLDFPAITRTLNEFVIPRGVPYKLLLNKVDTRRGQKRLDGWKQAIDEGYNKIRIAAHEIGHILGLPDIKPGPCSSLMSGSTGGVSCTNAVPNAAEKSRVERNFAGTATADLATVEDAA